METRRISIIILVHPGYESYLDECIPRVIDQEFEPSDCEYFLALNGICSKYQDLFKARYPKFTIVPLKKMSRSRARNMAAEMTSGTYLLFLDCHTRIRPDFLSKIYTEIEKLECDVVQPSLGFSEVHSYFAKRFYNIHKIQTGSSDNYFYDSYYQVFPSLDTSALMIRREVFNEIGGFDETFDRFEDRNLGLRLLNANYHIHGSLNIHATKSLMLKTNFRILRDGWQDIYFALKCALKEKKIISFRPLNVLRNTTFDGGFLSKLRNNKSDVPYTPDIMTEFVINISNNFVFLSSLFFLSFFYIFRRRKVELKSFFYGAISMTFTYPYIYWSCGDKVYVKFFGSSSKSFIFPSQVGLEIFKISPGQNVTIDENPFHDKIINKLKSLALLKPT